jgi:hypothetical protein
MLTSILSLEKLLYFEHVVQAFLEHMSYDIVVYWGFY